MTTRPMTDAERDYIEVLQDIQAKIDKLIQQRDATEKEFIENYAPYKVGDVIEIPEGMLTVAQTTLYLDTPGWFIVGKRENSVMGYHTITLKKEEAE